MKLVLTITSTHTPRVAVEKAIAGLVATTAEGAAIITALEALVEGPRCAPSTAEDVLRVLARVGSVKATARALGIARSTVRARRTRALAAGYAAPAIDADAGDAEWIDSE